ncbi:endolytic transglycosylase MltG [Thermodesulfobium acidiphilum]|nr:endolytic transglycosylase MltG [Thermodesulfobium acidiphilum]
MSRLKRWCICFVVFMAFLIVINFPYVLFYRLPDKVDFHVYKGESSSDVLQKLYKVYGTSPSLFADLYFRLKNFDPKPGNYSLEGSFLDSVYAIQKGPDDFLKVTFPEGLRIRDMVLILKKDGYSKYKEYENIAYNDLKSFSKKFSFLQGINSNSLEGFLFPDTYFISKNESPKEIIDMQLSDFEKRVWPLIKNRRDYYDVLKLASLVEGEAKVDKERPIIASVFLNRLKINMPLESCASVEYFLPVHKDVLSYADTRIESPYNTYIHYGLPPTPINSPSIKSIEAVLHPAHTKYLYFVAKGDGTHFFSQTYEEQQAFIKSLGG